MSLFPAIFGWPEISIFTPALAHLSVKLGKSGKAKIKKINATSMNKEVHAEIAGIETNFKLRGPIKGDGIEMGPYSAQDVEKVITEINQ